MLATSGQGIVLYISKNFCYVSKKLQSRPTRTRYMGLFTTRNMSTKSLVDWYASLMMMGIIIIVIVVVVDKQSAVVMYEGL